MKIHYVVSTASSNNLLKYLQANEKQCCVMSFFPHYIAGFTVANVGIINSDITFYLHVH